MGGKFHLKLNNGERPIANKYREGKMKRTLKRELKVLEIAKREALKTSDMRSETSSRFVFVLDLQLVTLFVFFVRLVVGSSLCVSQDQFDLWEKVVRKVGERSLLYSCDSTSGWIEEVIVRCLRLSPCLLRRLEDSIAMLCCSRNRLLFVGDSLCYHDLVRNGFHRPVLKHGPRSLTSMQVFE